MYHEEGLATQIKMKQLVQSLVEVISAFGNPLEDDYPELLVLNSRDCADESVISTVRSIECLGKTQYLKYVADVINSGKASIHDTIAKNSLPLFKSPRYKVKSKSAQQVTAQRSNVSLFGRLYVANQQRDGDLGLFFSHEIKAPPPSLSDFGKLRIGQKSALLTCIDFGVQTKPTYQFDSKIFDGSAVVHFLPTASARTFADYANEVIIPFLIHQLEHTNRVDCVWDGYIDCSIKVLDCGPKFSGRTKLPRKWSDFLRVAANNKELFHFLTGQVEALTIPAKKNDVYNIRRQSDMQRNRSKNAKM